MYEPSINYLAVLAGTIAHFMLGALWYSPILFSKMWISAIGWTEEEVKAIEKKGGHAKTLAIQFLGTLVLVFVTAHIVDFMKVVFGDSGMTNLSIGLTSGFWLWLGYIATFGLTGVVFEKHSWKLYGINMGYQFVGLMIASGIVAVWV